MEGAQGAQAREPAAVVTPMLRTLLWESASARPRVRVNEVLGEPRDVERLFPCHPTTDSVIGVDSVKGACPVGGRTAMASPAPVRQNPTARTNQPRAP